MSGKITITNQSGPVATIDIEGIIGVPEDWQFEEPGQRVATYETFRSVVESIRGVSSPEIIVNIRSTGGNVNDALLIFDTLGSLAARITTRCYGYVASAATVIAQAASTGCREISSNALYLIHKSVCSTEGNAPQISQALGMLEQTDERIAAIYAARSGKEAKQFADLMRENDGNGRWLSPAEALEFSLADRIIAGTPIAAAAGESAANMGLPPIPKQKNGKTMNIYKRWNAILQLLGLPAQDQAAEEEEVVSCQLALREETIGSMAQAQAEMTQAHRNEVGELKKLIASLEMQNARMAAAPTTTKPKEDPSVHQARRGPNEQAYYDDAAGFR